MKVPNNRYTVMPVVPSVPPRVTLSIVEEVTPTPETVKSEAATVLSSTLSSKLILTEALFVTSFLSLALQALAPVTAVAAGA
jgi:hypothetical protein